MAKCKAGYVWSKELCNCLLPVKDKPYCLNPCESQFRQDPLTCECIAPVCPIKCMEGYKKVEDGCNCICDRKCADG